MHLPSSIPLWRPFEYAMRFKWRYKRHKGRIWKIEIFSFHLDNQSLNGRLSRHSLNCSHYLDFMFLQFPPLVISVIFCIPGDREESEVRPSVLQEKMVVAVYRCTLAPSSPQSVQAHTPHRTHHGEWADGRVTGSDNTVVCGASSCEISQHFILESHKFRNLPSVFIPFDVGWWYRYNLFLINSPDTLPVASPLYCQQLLLLVYYSNLRLWMVTFHHSDV